MVDKNGQSIGTDLNDILKWIRSGILDDVDDYGDKINLAAIFEKMKDSFDDVEIYKLIIKKYQENKESFYLSGRYRLIIEVFKNKNYIYEQKNIYSRRSQSTAY